MQTADLFGQLSFSTEKMQKVAVFATERLGCDLYCFEPGQSQKLHTHSDSDKLYTVLEGRGTFRIGGQEQVLRSGQTALAPAGQEHGVENPGTDRLICLVVVCPLPKKD